MRLIDANALMEKFGTSAVLAWEDIVNAPTIIPAEEGRKCMTGEQKQSKNSATQTM